MESQLKFSVQRFYYQETIIPNLRDGFKFSNFKKELEIYLLFQVLGFYHGFNLDPFVFYVIFTNFKKR